MWEDGLVTIRHHPNSKCYGSTTRLRNQHTLGFSRTENPNDGLRPWKCLALWSWLCFCANEVPHTEGRFNFLWQVTTRAMCMACSMSIPRRCQRLACWWRICFSLQRTHVASCPSTSRGTSTNGLMILHIPLLLGLMKRCDWKYNPFLLTSRSFPGSYNISITEEIFHRQSWRSQSLLSLPRSDVGNVNVRLVGAYRPHTYGAVKPSLSIPPLVFCRETWWVCANR